MARRIERSAIAEAVIKKGEYVSVTVTNGVMPDFGRKDGVALSDAEIGQMCPYVCLVCSEGIIVETLVGKKKLLEWFKNKSRGMCKDALPKRARDWSPRDHIHSY